MCKVLWYLPFSKERNFLHGKCNVLNLIS
jgi:hypothetical protein